jgi:hypothetical protein
LKQKQSGFCRSENTRSKGRARGMAPISQPGHCGDSACAHVYSCLLCPNRYYSDFVIVAFMVITLISTHEPHCNHQIYCYGRISACGHSFVPRLLRRRWFRLTNTNYEYSTIVSPSLPCMQLNLFMCHTRLSREVASKKTLDSLPILSQS